MNNIYDKTDHTSQRACDLYEDLCVLLRMLTRVDEDTKYRFTNSVGHVRLRHDLKKVNEEMQAVQEVLGIEQGETSPPITGG